MIHIYLNDQLIQVKPDQSLQEVLIQHHHQDHHFAVAINNQLISRKVYKTTSLQADDRIDIIVPMQGG